MDESYLGRAFHCPACGTVLLIPSPASQLAVRQKSATISLPQIEPSASFYARVLRLSIGWGVGTILLIILILGLRLNRLIAQPYLPRHLDGIIRDVTSPSSLLNIPPLCNTKETLLLYARSVDGGMGLYLANLTTSERKQIVLVPETKMLPRFIGWSPDDRYLAFAATGEKNKPNQRIFVRDGASGLAQSSFDLPDPLEQASWLSTNSLILTARRKLYLYNFERDLENIGPFGKPGLVQLRFDFPVASSSLQPIGGRAVAFDDGSNIWHLIISSGRLTQLTHLTNVTIGQLDYSPENDAFLFSLLIAGRRADPSLYRFDPRTNNVTSGLAQFTDRFNFEHIYSGHWIAEGTGLAYAGQNFIGITLKGGAFHTNLFTQGYYRNFSVSPRGDKIFALASIVNEPLSIWAYDVNYGDLDSVVPPKERLEFSQWAEPYQVDVARTNGGLLAYSVLPPPHMSVGKKYPAVINLLGNNPYDSLPQFLANVGIISVSVRPKSSDDIKTIINDLLNKQANVDPQRLYLVAQGVDGPMVRNLLSESSGPWRGVILLWPTEFPMLQDHVPDSPQYLVFAGPNRDIVYTLKAERFLQMACQKLIPVRLLFDEDMAKLSPKSDLNHERYKAMVKLILAGELK